VATSCSSPGIAGRWVVPQAVCFDHQLEPMAQTGRFTVDAWLRQARVQSYLDVGGDRVAGNINRPSPGARSRPTSIQRSPRSTHPQASNQPRERSSFPRVSPSRQMDRSPGYIAHIAARPVLPFFFGAERTIFGERKRPSGATVKAGRTSSTSAGYSSNELPGSGLTSASRIEERLDDERDRVTTHFVRSLLWLVMLITHKTSFS
jgi:hypothetical protein